MPVRYGAGRKDCQIAMYFEQGTPLNSKPYYWEPKVDDDPDIQTWILDFVKVKVKFTNTFDNAIMMKETK